MLLLLFCWLVLPPKLSFQSPLRSKLYTLHSAAILPCNKNFMQGNIARPCVVVMHVNETDVYNSTNQNN